MPKVELKPQSWGSRILFYCPGCKGNHFVNVHHDGSQSGWTFNGDVERPTLSPSILVYSTALTAKGEADYQRWLAAGCPDPAPESFGHVDTVCHSFVRGGRIEFLGDCTHAFAGRTVELPEVERPTIGVRHPSPA